MKTLVKDIQKIVKPFAFSQGFTEVKVLERWSEIIGEQAAPYIRPKSLKGGVLTLAVADSSWAQEVNYMAEFLAEKINTFFGFKAVKKIKVFQQYFVPKLKEEKQTLKISEHHKQKADFIVKGVVDDNMREVLSKFGASIMAVEDKHK